MSILKSKAFWGISGTAGSIASALTYDRHEANKIRQKFLNEAEHYGEATLKEGDHERKVSLVLFAEDSESEQEQKCIFKKYSVDLLTKAGVDYQWLEYFGSSLDKRYYELKKEKDIKEIPDGQVPDEEEKQLIKAKIFTPENFIYPMVQSWFSGNVQQTEDEIQAKVQSEFFVKPVAPEFFKDGIIAMNPGTFRSCLWAYNTVSKSNQKNIKAVPAFGMINCEFPSSFLKRMYYKFNTRKIADVVGRETMAVIRAEVANLQISQVLPSEEPVSHIKVHIYKSSEEE